MYHFLKVNSDKINHKKKYEKSYDYLRQRIVLDITEK